MSRREELISIGCALVVHLDDCRLLFVRHSLIRALTRAETVDRAGGRGANGVSSPLPFDSRLSPAGGLVLHVLRQLPRARFAIPFLEGLRRDLALNEELGELTALCLAFERHTLSSSSHARRRVANARRL